MAAVTTTTVSALTIGQEFRLPVGRTNRLMERQGTWRIRVMDVITGLDSWWLIAPYQDVVVLAE